MDTIKQIWPLILGLLLLAFVLRQAFRRSGKPREAWRCIYEGELAKVVYGGDVQGFWEDGDTTTLTFADGQTVALTGKVEVPDHLGKHIRVLTDDEGCYSFEKAVPDCGTPDDGCCGKGCHENVPG